METEKNLHASVPPALLVRAHLGAEVDHIKVDELVQAALEQEPKACRRQKLYAYRDGQARSAAAREEDVPRVVAEWGAEHASASAEISVTCYRLGNMRESQL